MKITLDLPQEYYPAIKGTLSILLPEVDFYHNTDGVNVDLTVSVDINISEALVVKSYVQGNLSLQEEIIDKDILDSRYTEENIEKRVRERIKLSLYRVISKYSNKELSPWGILVGVRPTKLVHYLVDKAYSYERIKEQLQNVYGLAPEKIRLLIEVVKLERSYLPTTEEAQNRISIYLGIPFCPTRCNYCSFAAYPFKQHQKYLKDFLKAVHYEIKEMGRAINRLGLIVDTIYIGGGTPTVFSRLQLEKIIKELQKYFSSSRLKEFTVEAGRADTITREKLEMMYKLGIDRISINPQTMNQKTLDKIGRQHTVQEVYTAFKTAREVGFTNINMDLIVGLPGERSVEIKRTLEQILQLNPDSLTVHTMAIKRAAKMRNNLDQSKLSTSNEVEEMFALTKEAASQMKLKPYYMYRQKNMIGNLENIGYSRAGQESIYNILMMEERETIIALGGGGITKFVNPQNWRLSRLVNPKFPQQYINQVQERTAAKIAKLTSWV